mmetsp:Transcript_19521/g.29374  ORF Transcript_19521/g.29374 Transcript_19521/m.29374 type:complete len:145 (+) Transcript_19521:1608-2042(+)
MKLVFLASPSAKTKVKSNNLNNTELAKTSIAGSREAIHDTLYTMDFYLPKVKIESLFTFKSGTKHQEAILISWQLCGVLITETFGKPEGGDTQILPVLISNIYIREALWGYSLDPENYCLCLELLNQSSLSASESDSTSVKFQT